MPFLIVAVVFVGLLCTLDLVLSLGVIKRLREHTDLLSALNGRASLAAGEEVGEFTAVTVDGVAVSRAGLADDTLVGFFSPGCAACKEQLPKFVAYARALPGGRARVLAAVVGDPKRTAAMVAELAPVAQVVSEAPNGEVGSAFRIAAFPVFLTVSARGGGARVVSDARVDLEHLPSAVL
ncbi:TlpA family protein [Streptomyces albiaxialis]|uniref:TlpA family protein n=1 Tax=Streptomyces albiaxialis TaxID=329523 RepID=A0ABN2VPL6_9ACTN